MPKNQLGEILILVITMALAARAAKKTRESSASRSPRSRSAVASTPRLVVSQPAIAGEAGRPPRSSRRQDRVIEATARESKARSDVFGFEVRKLLHNLLLREPSRQEVEHVDHTDAHPSDARPPTALSGADGNAFWRGRHGLKKLSAASAILTVTLVVAASGRAAADNDTGANPFESRSPAIFGVVGLGTPVGLVTRSERRGADLYS